MNSRERSAIMFSCGIEHGRQPKPVSGVVRALLLLVALVISLPAVAAASQVDVSSLIRTGLALAEKAHYLEALDMLSEAGDALESTGRTQSREYGDVLFHMAQTKIKGRIHQDFPAYYVKSALREVQAANQLREKLPGVLPQQLAEGYYLEGVIHKKFFMGKKKALSCFLKAVGVDPGSAAAKRELSELIAGEENK